MDITDDQLAFEDGSIREFRQAVSVAAPDELEVTAITDGFDVVYRDELTQHGILMRIDSTFRGVITCDPAQRTFTLEDCGITQHQSLAGLRMTVSGFRGRQNATHTVTAWGTQDDGTWGEVSTQTQNTRVIHAAVRGPAAALGWTEKQPLSAKVGKTVAIVTGVGMIIAAVVVGVLALNGYFS